MCPETLPERYIQLSCVSTRQLFLVNMHKRQLGFKELPGISLLPMLIRPLREPLPAQQASGRWGRVSPAAPCCDLPPPYYSSPLGFYIFPCCSVLPPKLLSPALPRPAIVPSLRSMISLTAWPSVPVDA